ncbi:hypothetical protein PT974_10107 [Cladobotryum mycophilum]|uniref:40-residue YVTN family beta-propeller repeat-containing protein n=1 Tax=Cladobotryum mycophilum TaxID=491253 RepID=A0ABR0S9U9_9HYPO
MMMTMMFTRKVISLLALGALASAQVQAPALAGHGAPISDADRIYTGDQSSNTITVIKPKTGEVLGTINLGDSRLTDVIGPQYVKVVNSHGLGFSRDGKYIVSLSVTSNTVTVIRCADNSIVSQTSIDRNPHEAFFSADNRTIWVGTRGTDRIDIVDGFTGGIVGRVDSYGGPSKVLFSPDGKYAYANHIRSPSLSVIDVRSRKVVHNITGLVDKFSSDMMLSADGQRLWAAHKMVGKISIIDLRQNKVIGGLDTGSETNHPNFAVLNGTTYGFVTVAATNETKMYAQPDASKMPVYVGTIPSSGVEPHGLWPSADNTRMYIVNEHSDTVDIVDLTLNPPKVVKTLNVGQEGQALIYVANAVPSGDGKQNLGTSGLYNKPAVNKIITQEGAAVKAGNPDPSALITVRPQGGLDEFQIIGRDLQFNTTYTVSGSCCKCGDIKIPLVDFKATAPMGDGCGTAPQVLAFFKFFGVYELDSLVLTSVPDGMADV